MKCDDRDQYMSSNEVFDNDDVDDVDDMDDTRWLTPRTVLMGGGK
jgi:hypothetical protein